MKSHLHSSKALVPCCRCVCVCLEYSRSFSLVIRVWRGVRVTMAICNSAHRMCVPAVYFESHVRPNLRLYQRKGCDVALTGPLVKHTQEALLRVTLPTFPCEATQTCRPAAWTIENSKTQGFNTRAVIPKQTQKPLQISTHWYLPSVHTLGTQWDFVLQMFMCNNIYIFFLCVVF